MPAEEQSLLAEEIDEEQDQENGYLSDESIDYDHIKNIDSKSKNTAVRNRKINLGDGNEDLLNEVTDLNSAFTDNEINGTFLAADNRLTTYSTLTETSIDRTESEKRIRDQYSERSVDAGDKGGKSTNVLEAVYRELKADKRSWHQRFNGDGPSRITEFIRHNVRHAGFHKLLTLLGQIQGLAKAPSWMDRKSKTSRNGQLNISTQ
uniref:Uncharacterized protein n=1 Tax=Ditylenchus dipsaci TaxID=166011 RepID=A0A915ET71_9BILA